MPHVRVGATTLRPREVSFIVAGPQFSRILGKTASGCRAFSSLNSIACVRSLASRTARFRSGSGRRSIPPARSTTWPSPSCSKATSTRPLLRGVAARRRRQRCAAHIDRRCAAASVSGACGLTAARRRFSISPIGSMPEAEFRAWARERCARPCRSTASSWTACSSGLPASRYGWYLNQHHLVTDASSTVLLFRQAAAEYASRGARKSRRARCRVLEPYYPTAQLARVVSESAPVRRRGVCNTGSNGSVCDRVTPFYGRVGRASSTRSERLTLALDEATSRRLEAVSQRARVSEPHARHLDYSRSLPRAHCMAPPRRAASVSSGSTRPRTIGPRRPRNDRSGSSSRCSRSRCVSRPATRSARSARNASPRRSCSCGSRCPARARPSSGTASNVVLNFFSGHVRRLRRRPGFLRVDPPGRERQRARAAPAGARLRRVRPLHAAFRLQRGDVFRQRCGARAVAHFERLLAALLEDPDQVDLGSRPPHSRRARGAAGPVQRHRRATAAGRSGRRRSSNEQAARTPDRIALRQGARELTFGELRRDVRRRLPRSSSSIGVQPGEPVAVLMKRSIEAVIAILAVLKARGAYVPLDARISAAANPPHPRGLRRQHA